MLFPVTESEAQKFKKAQKSIKTQSKQKVKPAKFALPDNSKTNESENVRNTPKAVVWQDDFETDKGWTLTGEWERGAPGALGGEHGNPDPATAQQGTNVLGTDLTGLGANSGDYEAGLGDRAYTATSPVIDCSGHTDVHLSFQRWLNVESPFYDHAYIDVWDGSAWQEVWTNTGGIEDGAWSLQDIDISAHADGNAGLQVRFSIGETDGSWFYSGWNIDDLSITGTSVAPMSFVSSTVTQVNTTDIPQAGVNQEIICIEVVTSGSSSPIDLESVRLQTSGSTDPTNDITNAKLWYTGASSTFATTTQVGATYTPVPATATNYLISGTQTLQPGTNYFWLSYDIEASATIGNDVDALCNLITVDGSNYVPGLTNPAGSRTIFGPLTIPYSHNFDTQDGWITSGDDADIWERGDQTNNSFGPPSAYSGNFVYGTKLNANYDEADIEAYLETPIFDMSGTTAPRLSFWMDIESESGYDGGVLQINVNNGGWTTIDAADYTLNPPNDATVDGLGGGLGWSGTQPAGEWQRVQLELFNLTNTPLVITNSDLIQIRFWFGSDGSVQNFPGWYIDDFSIYEPNDETTEVDAPTSGQIPAGNISSTTTSPGSAVSVFSFDITDQGSGDGVSTFVTDFVIQNEGSGTADWTDHIAGAELWNGGAAIADLDVTITDTEITLSKTSGSFEVADGTSEEFTLKIWLNSSGIVDNSTMVFEIPTASHGFMSLVTGSEFAEPFVAATTSNTQTITVTATQLLFTGQPSSTASSGVALASQPIVSATDVNGNIDTDIGSLVTLANTGTLTMSNTSMNFVNGIADFGTPNNFMFTSGGEYVMLTASAPGLSTINPSNEIAVDIAGCTIFSEDFESYASTADLNQDGTGWDYLDLPDNPGDATNDWGIATSGNQKLTIHNGNTAFQYRNDRAADEIAYYTQLIDARNFKNLYIEFDWQGDAEAGFDYGMVVWSTDGTNWAVANPTELNGQAGFTSGSVDISVCDGQQFYIGFRWKNNGSVGSNPSFAVDDVSIKGFPKFDYNFSYRQDTYEPIVGTIASTNGNGSADISLPAGFDFQYDGTSVTSVKANINGWLEAGTAYSADAAPTNDLTSPSFAPFMAPLWDDLNSDAQTQIKYGVSGTAPSRVFTVEWTDVLWGSERQNFQVKLYETSYVIEFWYGDMTTNSSGSASIGINNIGGCLNKMISVIPSQTPAASYTSEFGQINSAAYLNSGMVYIFNPHVMQEYSTWQSASVVVGQTDFNTINTTASQTVAEGAYSSNVSSKGVLASSGGSSNRVLLWNNIQTTNGQAADVVIGQSDFSSTTPGTSATELENPHNVCFTPDGDKLLVVDAGNNRVLIYNSVPADMSGAPYAADVVIGQTDFTSRSSGTAADKLTYPTGAIVLPDGKLLITDFGNNRVLVFNSVPTVNGASADYVIGQPDLTTTSAGTTADKLGSPWDCAFSPDGKLLVSDDNAHRVLIFNTVPTSSGQEADLVIGNNVFGPKVAGSDRDEFDQPSITCSVEGKLAIADFGNSRVMVYERAPKTNGAEADYVLGQPNYQSNTEFNDGFDNVGSPDDKNMFYPYSICFDLNGRLYVNGTHPNGTGMHRIMIYGTPPTQIADLEINITSNETDVCIFADVEYTVNVTNHGGDNATNVVVNAQLPVGFNLNEYDASIGTYNGKSGYWTIPYIAVGETVTLTFEGEVQPDLGGKNVVAYSNVLASKQADDDFSNNGDNQIVAVKTFFAPTSTDIADQYIDRNDHTNPVISFTVDDQDGIGDITSYTCTSSNETLIPVDYTNNLLFAGAEPDKTLDIHPAADEYGFVEMQLVIEDSHGCYKEYDFEVTVGNIWRGVGDMFTPNMETDWQTANNWTSGAVPTSTVEAIIPTNPEGGYFPVIDEGGDVCEDLYIEPGASVTVEDGFGLRVFGDMFILSDEIATGSLVDYNSSIFNRVDVGGTIYVDRYISPDAWHYLSSPLTGVTNKVLTEDVCGPYNGNVLDYNEEFSYDYDADGDIDWFDGWEWPWYYTQNNDLLEPANGYAYYTFAGTCSKLVRFTGAAASLNSGNYTYTVTNQDDTFTPTGTNPHRGWNLVGNPYPSGLNATEFITENAVNNTIIDGTLYFWDEDGFTGFELEGADYASYNMFGATTGAGAGSVLPDNYISNGQAFFVHRTNTDVTGTDIIFTNSMREAESSSFFKKKKEKENSAESQKVKLSLRTPAGLYNEALVGFKEDATNGFDPLYDGLKMEGNPDFAFYSLLNGKNYAIQALNPLETGNSKSVALGFNASDTGTYIINVQLLQEIPENTAVFLKDHRLNKTVDLKRTQSYEFNIESAGRNNERFELLFYNNTPPYVQNPMPDMYVDEDFEYSFEIPESVFADIDQGDELAYSASLQDGSVLPYWISFNPQTRTLSGTPENRHVGLHTIKLTASDSYGASTQTSFNLHVKNTNDAPVVNTVPENRRFEAGESFQFHLDENTFTDIDIDDVLTIELVSSINNLQWLNFDAQNLSFSGTAPAAGEFRVTLRAYDLQNAHAECTFTIMVKAPTAVSGSNSEELGIYPNPSNGKFTIQNLPEGTEKISISDETGKFVYENVTTSNLREKKIEAQKLAEGVYHIHIQSNGKNYTLPLIIKK